MAEFDLKDLEKINRSGEIIDLLVAKGIIKEKKFKEQLAYEKELAALQFEMLRLQQFVAEHNKRLLLIFEGRDAAGKGGTISRMIAKLNPKKYRVVALSKPSDEEQKQWYFQRYIKHLPQAGEIVFFDRSWYNRAGVEPVFGFCTKEQYAAFMKQVNPLEHLLIDDGVIVVKLFLTISKKEQEERLTARKNDPEKKWKIGALDEKAQEVWDDYSAYFEKLFKKTATKKSPWLEIISDEKKVVRLEVMKYVLNAVEGFAPREKSDTANDKSVLKVHQ